MPTARKDFGAERNRLRGLCLNASALIDELQRMYPPATPSLDATERELWAGIGARKVVELLVQLRGEAQAASDPLSLR